VRSRRASLRQRRDSQIATKFPIRIPLLGPAMRNLEEKYVSTSYGHEKRHQTEIHPSSETDQRWFMRYSASRRYLFFLNNCQQEIEKALTALLAWLSRCRNFRHRLAGTFDHPSAQVGGQLASR